MLTANISPSRPEGAYRDDVHAVLATVREGLRPAYYAEELGAPAVRIVRDHLRDPQEILRSLVRALRGQLHLEGAPAAVRELHDRIDPSSLPVPVMEQPAPDRRCIDPEVSFAMASLSVESMNRGESSTL